MVNIFVLAACAYDNVSPVNPAFVIQGYAHALSFVMGVMENISITVFSKLDIFYWLLGKKFVFEIRAAPEFKYSQIK